MKNRIVTTICFLVGLALCSYPLFRSLAERQYQEEIVATYQRETGKNEHLEEILLMARDYNSMLNQTNGASVGNIAETILSDDSYRRQLNTGESGVMGALEIPKINVNLPIRHGTEEKVIANGVGHFQSSSLPVGGESTRCILTSHRGLPSSKLFTRLDELEVSDLFFIKVCGETLAYQIYEIQVMEPEEAEELHVLPERDIVSLITCTPYGLNTHRLVVNGERVSYEEQVHNSIKPQMVSMREIIFVILPFTFSAIMAGMHMRNRKRCKRKCRRKRKRHAAGYAK